MATYFLADCTKKKKKERKKERKKRERDKERKKLRAVTIPRERKDRMESIERLTTRFLSNI